MRPILLMLAALACAGQSVRFEQNVGQTASEVRYYARTSSGTLFLADSSMTFSRDGSASRIEFVGALGHAVQWSVSDRLAGINTYYSGRDSSHWAKDVPAWGQLVRHELYPGIDVRFHSATSGRLEYDFLLAPAADASRIRIRVSGATARVGRDGSLDVASGVDLTLIHHRPVAWQLAPDGTRRDVAIAYRLGEDGEVSLDIADFDHARELVIDPVVDARYVGGAGQDRIVAANGSCAVGMTDSIDFPGAAFGRRRQRDVFIRTNAGTVVIGGAGDDYVTAASLGNCNLFLIGGYTDSRDLPTELSRDTRVSPPTRAWRPDYMGGASDGFLIRYNAFEARLFVTYLGTSGDDRVTGIGEGLPVGTWSVVGETNGTGLFRPEWLLGKRLLQPEPAGGVDGFAMSLTSSFGINVDAATFLGGTGDDHINAVWRDYSTGRTYVGGETSSPNMLGSTRAISGDSDAFLLTLDPALSALNVMVFGGSGREAVTSVQSVGRGPLLVGGWTGSRDFPVKNAAQPEFGGGDTDAFLARFPFGETEPEWMTLYGGSGEERISAVDSILAVFAGWTSSRDLPVRNPGQQAFGGGPDDGLIVATEPDGSIRTATWFGGSGTDRIYSLRDSYIAGETTSPDLPESVTDSRAQGGADGFIAAWRENRFITQPLKVGKDLRADTYVRFGYTPPGGDLPATRVSSSDPERVVVAARSTEPGSASVDFPAGSFQPFIDCLRDSGTAILRIQAEGFDDASLPITCGPAFFSIGYPAAPGQPAASFQLGGSPVSMTAWLLGERSAAGVPLQWPRPGAPSFTVDIENSDPTIGSVPSSITLSATSTPTSFSFTPLQAGQTTLRFRSPQLGPPEGISLPVNVTPALTVRDAVVPAGHQILQSLSVNAPSTGAIGGVPLIVQSGDPARLLLSTDPSRAGQAQIELYTTPRSAQIFLQALGATGTVPLIVSTPTYGRVTAMIQIVRPRLQISSTSSLSELSVGEPADLSLYVSSDPFPSGFVYALPGAAPPTATFRVPDPSVAIIEGTGTLPAGPSSAAVRLRGVQEGRTSVAVELSSDTLDTAPPLPVEVRRRQFRTSLVEVGRRLAALVRVPLPFPCPAPAAMKVTTEDPAVATVSLDSSQPGQPVAETSLPARTDSVAAWVHGVTLGKRTKLRLEVEGYEPAVFDVVVVPAGIAWMDKTITRSLKEGQFGGKQAFLTAAALDPDSLMPISSQRFEAPVTITLESSDTGVVDLATATLKVEGQAVAELIPKTLGTATIRIRQPAGLNAPSNGTELTIVVTP